MKAVAGTQGRAGAATVQVPDSPEVYPSYSVTLNLHPLRGGGDSGGEAVRRIDALGKVTASQDLLSDRGRASR
ncbi:MAG TPA: hypothetical protein VES02_13295 [Dermatophilaceae bacterium]|nr:hypothetical protein [Dermatophilaceae bacterium]